MSSGSPMAKKAMLLHRHDGGEMQYQALDNGSDIQSNVEYVDYQYAVDIENLWRSYGKTDVLTGLNMQVPVGNIYGLLGPSGCGKTTLLKCILGRLDIHGGSVHVLGGRPGDRNHSIPGPSVGYMPQELAIVPEFSIDDSLRYFARLFRIPNDVYEQRRDHLLEFLNMPPKERLVRNLSGGQQRRVSLCIALIHRPRLLILDEPTVGVDPLLRAKIWEFLEEVAQQGTSIIITTHYIEEARQANKVGLMRNGRILAEGNPDDIMAQYRKDTLEDAFLQICFAHDDKLANADDDHSDDRPQVKRSEINPKHSNCYRDPPRCHILWTLLWSSFQRMRRNVAFLIFQFFMPALQVILFCLAIGKNPQNLDFTFVSHDQGMVIDGIHLNVGETLLAELQSGNSFHMHERATLDEGLNMVRHGDSWGVLQVPDNCTGHLYDRYVLGKSDRHTIEGSTLLLRLDNTNEQIAVFIQTAVTDAYKLLITTVNFTNGESTLPINVGTPVYGPVNPKFTDFIAPGMIIAIAFAQAIALTAVALVMEKKLGNMDRMWAAGVRPSEIMVNQVLNQFWLLFVQIGILLFFALVIFKLPMEGSLFLVLALAMLLGMAGMVYGLVIAASTDDEQVASQIAMGSFFPALLLSGIIWPTQAIPIGLRYISYALPTTWAADSLRSIMARGWGMSEDEVWQGFAVTAGWGLFFFLLSINGLSNRGK